MLIPDQETAVDFLNYEAVSKTVFELLKANRQHALTLGIHGDWGAGKSSVLKMVQTSMAADDKVACLWFNGWAFQGFDDAKTVLIEVIITELRRQRRTSAKVQELSKKLLKRVDWLKLARRGGGLAFTLATGLPSPGLIATAQESLEALAATFKGMKPEEIEGKLTEAATYLKPAGEHSIPDEIHDFRKEFAELLEEAKIDQLVVLIDDLDRCLPATAIDTLEAIRLFLFVPKTAFVIGADESMIEYAVRRHFPDLPLGSGGVPYTRNYLEKLIQVPFRIPALGVEESRTYVTLLLVQDLVGEEHTGFKALLAKARTSLNQPWLTTGITQADVRAVDPARQTQLDAHLMLAQRIGPILAEGTKGNPRQVKRFLNSLFIRLKIAEERGFGRDMNPSVLGKLMLAERFQQDFYDHLAAQAMLAPGGKVAQLGTLEAAARDGRAAADRDARTPRDEAAKETAKWLEREWLVRWLKIDPALGDVDLRPYAFIARDKRLLAGAAESTGLEPLIETLMSDTDLVVRSVEPTVRALPGPDAAHVFGALKERVVRHGSFVTVPPGFAGMKLVAKHHPAHQAEIVALLDGVDVTNLGFWVVRGWDEVITEPAVKEQLQRLLAKWAAQTQNGQLKNMSSQALTTPRRPAR